MNGDRVWSAGFGLADVEQMVPCTADTVMRIASISKSITATIAARLVQNGKLNLDTNVQVSSRLQFCLQFAICNLQLSLQFLCWQFLKCSC